MQLMPTLNSFAESGPMLPQPLREFIDRLKVEPGAKKVEFLVGELARFAPTRELLEEWVSFDPDVYARNSIYRDDDFEAMVLAWQSGQRSPIHNHKGSSCAVYVVEGIASEIVFERSPHGALYPVGTQHCLAGATCGSSDQEIHQIANLQPPGSDLISLHVYSPPLKAMELFSLSQSTFADYDDLLIRSTRRTAA